MRLIGYIAEESAARVFGDYLYVEGVENQVEREPDGWGIWIADEDKIELASRLLGDFNKSPLDPKYSSTAGAAAKLRAEAEKDEERYRQRVRKRRHLFRPLTAYGFGPLTFLLIVISVLVFLLSGYGFKDEAIRGLFITDFTGGVVIRSLPEIRHGELWRLLTPIFIHFGPIHILCNMLWLRDLGSMIEGRQSSWHLGALVLIFGICSNLAQSYTSGPAFGGMSGVAYGLLGYIWICGKRDPGSGLYLDP